MMTKEMSTIIVNFMTQRARILGRGHVFYYSENILYTTLSIHRPSIVIVLMDYTVAFLCHC